VAPPPADVEADEALWFTFRAHGRKWRVLLVLPDHDELTDDEGDRLWGCCDHETRTIYVDASVSPGRLTDTVHHELTHAAIWEGLPARVRETPLSVDTEEVVIRCATPVICRVARITWPPFPPEAQALRRIARKKAA
jgi:hypothetical protein